MKKSLVVLIALVLLGTTGFSFAQDKNGSNPKMSPKARVARQHARIKNGVKNGTITKSQHKQLAQQGKAINSQRKADLAANGGKMPQSDRAQLEKEQNARSQEIKADKASNQ